VEEDKQLLSAWERIVRLAQAMGMVSANVECTLKGALTLIDACAQVSGRSIDEITAAIVAREDAE
jgi:hypothetical protein